MTAGDSAADPIYLTDAKTLYTLPTSGGISSAYFSMTPSVAGAFTVSFFYPSSISLIILNMWKRAPGGSVDDNQTLQYSFDDEAQPLTNRYRMYMGEAGQEYSLRLQVLSPAGQDVTIVAGISTELVASSGWVTPIFKEADGSQNAQYWFDVTPSSPDNIRTGGGEGVDSSTYASTGQEMTAFPTIRSNADSSGTSGAESVGGYTGQFYFDAGSPPPRSTNNIHAQYQAFSWAYKLTLTNLNTYDIYPLEYNGSTNGINAAFGTTMTVSTLRNALKRNFQVEWESDLSSGSPTLPDAYKFKASLFRWLEYGYTNDLRSSGIGGGGPSAFTDQTVFAEVRDISAEGTWTFTGATPNIDSFMADFGSTYHDASEFASWGLIDDALMSSQSGEVLSRQVGHPLESEYVLDEDNIDALGFHARAYAFLTSLQSAGASIDWDHLNALAVSHSMYEIKTFIFQIYQSFLDFRIGLTYPRYRWKIWAPFFGEPIIVQPMRQLQRDDGALSDTQQQVGIPSSRQAGLRVTANDYY